MSQSGCMAFLPKYKPDSWQCTANDINGHAWPGEDDRKLMALNKAFNLCQYKSKDPITCRTVSEGCLYIPTKKVSNIVE